jgi:hypothetical protein
MARSRIAVSLGNVPQMLRTIVLNTLEHADDIELLEYDAEDPQGYDVLIVARGSAPRRHIRSGRLGRVIEIDPDGRQATVHWQRHKTRMRDLSPEQLLALATSAFGEDTWPAQNPRDWLRLVDRMFGTRLRALPAPHKDARHSAPTHAPKPPPPPADPVIGELARLAARLAGARGTGHADRNPELSALAHALATRSGSAKALPELDRIAALFQLEADERDLLFLAAVVEIEPQAARLVALLNDHMSRNRPTPGLIAAFGGDARRIAARLARDGPLLRYALVRLEGEGPVTTQSIIADPSVWPLIFGLERRAPFAIEPLDGVNLEDLPLSDAMRGSIARARAALATHSDGAPVAAIVGEAETGRGAIARAVASRLRGRALIVPGTDLPDEAAVGAVIREALLGDAAVILLAPEACGPGAWRALVAGLPAPLICVTTPDRVGALALEVPRPLSVIEAPGRDLPQRTRIWAAGAPSAWPEQAIATLAERFGFGAARVSATLALATTRGQAEGRPSPLPEDARAAGEMLRGLAFDGAAERLACPFEPDEIVLRDETQRELDLTIAWANHGARLFDPDGPAAALHAGSGMACLFAGPSGTGKTMAAQIVARQIDYTLYRIDLSQVIDKFIGESEKRMATLFDEAERSRVALFFDEADALFGRRTEVRDSHDRYANIAVDYLLQRLESFQGLAILATNLAENIDGAFLRRIRVRAEFQAPDAGQRQRIWDKLLPPREARPSGIDVARLADPYPLVGGEIRNAVYTAHLLAAAENESFGMRHCVAGLIRELAKTGRISDLTPLDPWRAALP